MKIKSISIVLLLLCFAIPCFAGSLNISGRAGIYTINQSGASTSMMYGVAANYGITDNLSLRGAIDTTTYSVNGVQSTYTPISLDLIYSQSIIGVLTPYVGAGATYNMMTTNGVSTQTNGAELIAGAKFALLGFSAGTEYRYMMPDLNHTNVGSSVVTAYMTGAFTQGFNF